MNGDGCGYAFIDNGHVHIVRAVKWAHIEEQFKRDNARYGPASPFLVHFRIKTTGDVNKGNCHPFRMADGGALIHNGIIDMYDIPKEQSDTRFFTNKIIDSLPKNWQYDGEWMTMVGKMIGASSKMVFLWPNGSHYILGESKGFWEDNHGNRIYKKEEQETQGMIWYSNDSCRLPSPAQLEARKNPVKIHDYREYHNWQRPLEDATNPKGGQKPSWTTSPTQSDGTNKALVQTGEHTFRVKSAAEMALEKMSLEAEAEAASAVKEAMRIASLDEDEWEVECIDNAHMCPKCGDQFGTRGVAYYHFKNCNKTMEELLRGRL